MTRPFHGYQYFWPCDLDLQIWPTFYLATKNFTLGHIFVPRRNEFREGDIEILVSVRRPSVRHNFVDATPLRALNGFHLNFVGLLVTICSRSYYTAILIRQILRELWDFVDFFCTYATVDFVDATSPRPLNGFHSNFVGLLVTICSWSYYTGILIRQILRELWDFVDFFVHATL